MRKYNRWLIDFIWVILLSLGVSYSWMSTSVSAPNERSRLYLSWSIAKSSALNIDEPIKRWGSIFDLAKRGEQFYSDKAPGSSLLAYPVAAMSDEDIPFETLLLRARRFVAVPAMMLSCLLILIALRKLDLSVEVSRFAVMSFAFGTNVFHYGNAFFGHVFVAAAALLSLVLLLYSGSHKRPWLRVVGVFLAGWFAASCVLIEYQASVILLAGGLAVLFSRQFSWREILAGILGTIVPLSVLLYYNDLAFGSPLSTSYDFLAHDYSKAIHERGFGGVSLPSLEAVAGLLFRPSRGLLFCAPVVLFGAFGAILLWQRQRFIALFSLLALLGYFYVASSVGVWHGGWGFGPRLLIPVYGLAVVAAFAAFWCQESASKGLQCLRGAMLAMVMASCFYISFVIVAFPEIPPQIHSPLMSVALPLHIRGVLSPSWLAQYTALPRSMSYYPLLALLILCVGHTLFALRNYLDKHGLCAGLLTLVLWVALLASWPEQSAPDQIEPFLSYVNQLPTR